MGRWGAACADWGLAQRALQESAGSTCWRAAWRAACCQRVWAAAQILGAHSGHSLPAHRRTTWDSTLVLRVRCICAGDWHMQPCFCTWQAWHNPEGLRLCTRRMRPAFMRRQQACHVQAWPSIEAEDKRTHRNTEHSLECLWHHLPDTWVAGRLDHTPRTGLGVRVNEDMHCFACHAADGAWACPDSPCPPARLCPIWAPASSLSNPVSRSHTPLTVFGGQHLQC